MDDKQPPEFLTVQEYSRRSTFSLSTVHRRIADGSLPVIQPGGKRTAIRIPATVLELPAVSEQPTGTEQPTEPSSQKTRSSQPPACRRPRWQRRR